MEVNWAQEDIRQIDFKALRKAGYRGAVFDKDNCLTLPHHDTLILELQDSWDECREVFGEKNVLIVSNSAGSQLDSGGIQAESVSRHLRVPVLRHASPKPAYSCIKDIQTYFASLHSSPSYFGIRKETTEAMTNDVQSESGPPRDSELIVVGDRIFTDVVLANRMQARFTSKSHSLAADPGPGTLAIWTTHVWQKEAMFLRWAERKVVRVVEWWNKASPDFNSGIGKVRFVKKVGEAN